MAGSSAKRKVISTAIGTFLVHFVYGIYQAAASITPYVTKYFDVPLDYGVYIYYVHGAGLAVGVVIGVKVFKPVFTRIGDVYRGFFGGFIMVLSLLAAYFVVKFSNSFVAFLFCYCLPLGFGIGLGTTSPMLVLRNWMPNNSSLAVGVVNSGIGIGAAAFAQIEKAFIYMSASGKIEDEDDLYTPQNRHCIPMMFLWVACSVVVLQVFSYLLIYPNPTPQDLKDLSSADDECAIARSDGENPEPIIPRQEVASGPVQVLTRRRANTAPPRRLNTDFRLSVCSVYVDDNDLDEEGFSLTLKQALKTKTYYALMSYSMFFGAVMLYVCASTKIVSSGYQLSDSAGTLIVSLGNICDAFGRIFWGWTIDRFGFKFTITIMGTCTALLFCTMDPLMRLCGESGHAVCLIITWSLACGLTSGLFVVMAASPPHYFGTEYTNEIYSLLNLCYCVSVVFLCVCQPALKDLGIDHGFWIVFLIFAVLSAISSISPLFLPKITHVKQLEIERRQASSSSCGSTSTSGSRQALLRRNTDCNRVCAIKPLVMDRDTPQCQITRDETAPLLNDAMEADAVVK